MEKFSDIFMFHKMSKVNSLIRFLWVRFKWMTNTNSKNLLYQEDDLADYSKQVNSGSKHQRKRPLLEALADYEVSRLSLM